MAVLGIRVLTGRYSYCHITYKTQPIDIVGERPCAMSCQDLSKGVGERRPTGAVTSRVVTRVEIHTQTCQVSRNFRESPEIGRDLQVSRNCKENSRN